ncbi:hypothetical protein Fot_25053 [Forsythia ovata]|uniref:Uncharacterized protein n=1 Tax=Forsythia ovata TaxID=205694 RepID=A0ABD1U7X8_9LAMI
MKKLEASEVEQYNYRSFLIEFIWEMDENSSSFLPSPLGFSSWGVESDPSSHQRGQPLKSASKQCRSLSLHLFENWLTSMKEPDSSSGSGRIASPVSLFGLTGVGFGVVTGGRLDFQKL